MVGHSRAVDGLPGREGGKRAINITIEHGLFAATAAVVVVDWNTKHARHRPVHIWSVECGGLGMAKVCVHCAQQNNEGQLDYKLMQSYSPLVEYFCI